MPHTRLGPWLSGLGALVGGCLLSAGCHTTPLTSLCSTPAAQPSGYTAPAPTVRMASADVPRPAAIGAVLGPGTVVEWNAEPTRGAPSPGIPGKSVVTSDGQLNLGPYGAVHVGGLTVQQASSAVAKYLAQHGYMNAPRVHLKAMIHVASTSPRNPADAHAPLAPQQQSGPPNRVAQTSWQTIPPGNPGVTGASWPGSQPANPGPALTLPQPGAGAPGGLAAGPVGPQLLDNPPGGSGGQTPMKPSGMGDTQPPAKGSAKGIGEGEKGDDQNTEEAPAPRREGTSTTANAGPGYPGVAGPRCATGHAPNELTKVALPPYKIEPPDILLVQYAGKVLPEQAVGGQHLVRPDGRISLGIYGDAYVGGLTLDEARVSITRTLEQRLKDFHPENLVVDVLAYNSKVYYVITDGAGYGEQIFRFPITGSETVLDALALINGLPPVASKVHIWVARRTPQDCGRGQVLPVNYVGTTQCGLAGTNYQLMPGDRVYVYSDPWRRFDTTVAKVLSPFERIFGFTLLGAETVSAVKAASRSSSGTGGTTGSTP